MQYYDFPAVSVRAAMWHLMRAGVQQFKVCCRCRCRRSCPLICLGSHYCIAWLVAAGC